MKTLEEVNDSLLFRTESEDLRAVDVKREVAFIKARWQEFA